jgi:hypothetical protein
VIQQQHRNALRIEDLGALGDYERQELVELQLCGKLTRQVVEDFGARVA